jgi:SAM-dependent methyltransferase
MIGLFMLDFDRTMSPDDHMLTANLESYYKTAQSGFDCVMAGVNAAKRDPDTITDVLDFGSGYGRVYRALAAGFPNAKLTACDLMEEAAKFCAETFGGDYAISHEDLDQVKLPRQYDLTWLGSVFTHLPAYRWITLLDFLAAQTKKDGLVVFTSHGDRGMNHIETVLLKRNPYAIDAERFQLMRESIARTGFDFIANKPAAIKHQKDMGMDVTQGEYGFSFAQAWWVDKMIENSADWELVKYAAPGWAGNHDSVTIRRL